MNVKVIFPSDCGKVGIDITVELEAFSVWLRQLTPDRRLVLEPCMQLPACPDTLEVIGRKLVDLAGDIRRERCDKKVAAAEHLARNHEILLPA